MRLDEIHHTSMPRKRRRRVGRGVGSGRGKTSGRGQKGMGARTGLKLKAHAFEGGQMPLVRRLPKRGFNNERFRGERPVPVNVEALNAFRDGTRVDAAALQAKGLVRRGAIRLKWLGVGKVRRKLTVVAHAFSKTARTRIEAAGGTVEQIPAVGAGRGEARR